MNENSEEINIDLEPISIDREDLDFLRDLAKERKIEYFNIRFAKGKMTSFSLLKKITKSSSIGIGKGFSIQAFTKGGYGFAVGYKFNKETITETFHNAADLAHWSAQFVKSPFSIQQTDDHKKEYVIPQKISIGNTSPDKKMQMLLEIENEAYYDPRIKSTNVNYSDLEVENIIYNNFNRFVRLKNSWVFFILQAIASDGNRQEGYHVSHGRIGGFEALSDALGLGHKAAESAIELLDSKIAPGGKFNIILDPMLCGTFIHEAFGHTAEADGVISGESILSEKIGQKIGNPNVNIVDNPYLETWFGYLPVDSEGTETQKTQIVKNGELINFLHSLETSSRMGCEPTGNGRASGFSSLPQVRMTNTYLEPGDSNLDEMLSELKNGLLCVNWKYGYVDPIEGTHQFKMAKAYKIENGEKTQIYRDAAISGLTLDVLNRISLIGNKIEYDAGYCSKGGQHVPVGSGGPYVMLKNMIIGGR
ncbi:MAG: TldD/PmbA family protein [Candidatus Lokiarchaeota archaeon]|nr:TldD/PmbA family protein [Candidatus Harpocratesius repetitus]